MVWRNIITSNSYGLTQYYYKQAIAVVWRNIITSNSYGLMQYYY